MGNSVRIARGMLAQERRDGRAVMGYLLGLAIMAYFAGNYLEYAREIGEPVNVLETFCVAEHHHLNMLFLIFGWMLVTADAPFVKKNTYLLLYRCGRRRWNAGMLLYLLGQAFLYAACTAAFTAVLGSARGFAGDVWSSPAYFLAMDLGTDIGAKYNVSFSRAMLMKSMTVPQAFAVTFLLLYLYLVLFGMVLYVCSLLLPGIWGEVVTLGLHLLGYWLMLEGKWRYSLTARAVPGSLMDGRLRYWDSAVIFLGLIAAMACLSFLLVPRVDFSAQREGGTG